VATEPHGWRPDPVGIHEERFFNNGEPTQLVFDGAVAFLEESLLTAGPEPLETASLALIDVVPTGEEPAHVDAAPAASPNQAPAPRHDCSAEQSVSRPPPGWYRDLIGVDEQRWWDEERWWDGERWTESVRPAPPPRCRPVTNGTAVPSGLSTPRNAPHGLVEPIGVRLPDPVARPNGLRALRTQPCCQIRLCRLRTPYAID
jgi:hypothetical protein